MHGDEAVNAVKFSQLLETGKYDYNPTEYHGPTLYYFTLPVSWLTGATSLEDLSETTVRIIPLIFGVGLILILFILKPGLGWNVLLIAAFLTAISPSFVFYSRYYIHEMLLVFFCYFFIFSSYRYIRSKNLGWIITSGISLGLLVSTKETWSLIIFSILLATALIFLLIGENRKNLLIFLKSIAVKDMVIFFSLFIFTSVLFYSSFFNHPEGILNSLSSYSSYIDRAGNNEYHVHPWYMYFKWLIFFGGNEGFFWSEGIIAVFALFGIIGIVSKKFDIAGQNSFLQFILIFVLSTTIIFSLIPYKTPWNFLTFWFGFIFIGAIGIIFIFKKLNKKSYRVIFILVSLTAIIHLGWQSYQLNYVKSYDPTNPYVYAHPGEDVFKITSKLEQLATNHQDGYQLYIQVIAKDSDYWPLPWYLRKFKRIGWWDRIDDKTASAPVIITQPEIVERLIYKLYEKPPPGKRDLYLPLFEDYTELRPGKELRGYIRKDHWDILNSQDVSVDMLDSE